MEKVTRNQLWSCFAALLLFATSCKEGMVAPEDEISSESSLSADSRRDYHNNHNTTFYALAGGLTLDKFSTSDPYEARSSVTVQGLQSGETILAMDFRPATGQLYGVGSTSRLYVINPESGIARMIGPGPFSPAISGTRVAFDFNPTVDRIRLVTNTGQNLRLNPETGTVAATDGNINGQAGADIEAVAYANNKAGATTTTLYDIDINSDKLFIQNPPNEGTLVEVGALNINVEGEGGFDISSSYSGLGVFKVDGKSSLITVNLKSGKAKVIASYSKDYTAIAILTKLVAYAASSANDLLIFGLQKDYSRNGDNNVISKKIIGLQSGESVVGLDMRPANGQLYALGSLSNVYTINASSGAATLVSSFSPALSGSSFGFDFNPVVDRIRIVSNTGQNLRYNQNDGSVTVDANLNPGSPAVSAVAYANNFAGTTSTTLFAIDHDSDKLYRISPPNAGTLVEIGGLGVNISPINGFDIGGESGKAYVVSNNGYKTKVYRISTDTGRATEVASIGSVSINAYTLGLGF